MAPSERARSFSFQIKYEVLLRQRGKCVGPNCGGREALPREAVQFHHVVGYAEGGKTVASNCIAVCANCHMAIHHLERAGVHAAGSVAASAPADASAPPEPVRPEPRILTLSARTPKALRRRADDLLKWLFRTGVTDLADPAFTLLAGRSAMACRLALVCADAGGAINSLRAYLGGQGDATGLFRGNAAKKPSGHPPPAPDSPEAAARLWVQGYAPDGYSDLFHGGGSRRRLSMPVYPFEQRSYWLPEDAESADGRQLSLVRQEWQPLPAGPATTGDEPLIILTGRDGKPLAEALMAGAGAREGRCITVGEGGLSPADPDGARRLAAALPGGKETLCLIDLTDISVVPTDREDLETGRLAFYQELVGSGRSLTLLHVSAGLGLMASNRPTMRGALMTLSGSSAAR